MIKKRIMAAAVLLTVAAMALAVAGSATAGGNGAQRVSGSDAFGIVSGSLEGEMTDAPDSFASFLRTRRLTPSGELVCISIFELSRLMGAALRFGR